MPPQQQQRQPQQQQQSYGQPQQQRYGAPSARGGGAGGGLPRVSEDNPNEGGSSAPAPALQAPNARGMMGGGRESRAGGEREDDDFADADVDELLGGLP
mmetsp:Transcript_33876/g.42734  ORF Transcript_33876/g.42734 Transcript_33876/m.42734 type:complete len:99 (-) Transcript_33876:190-486(-)